MKGYRPILAALFAGLLFGAGLIIGGMTQPSKVIGFLDVAGDWDPSLAFVMGGAIVMYMPLFRLITKRRSPLFGDVFGLPTRKDIDGRLILGSVLFGVGWGLAGYCPGPALTSLSGGGRQALILVTSMLVGFGIKRLWDARRAQLHHPPVDKPDATTRQPA